MNTKYVLLYLFVIVFTAPISARIWQPDVLGKDYLATILHLKADKGKEVVATLVKKAIPQQGNIAVLYIHGFNDYFFQRELGDSVAAHQMGFYALDLRRYGRSLRNPKDRYQITNMEDYFEEIDSTLAIIRSEGYQKIVCMGHSNGGLVWSYYLSKRQAYHPEICGLILNSPFLDMNLGKFLEKVALPFVTSLPFKGLRISQGKSRAYAESLLQAYHGEWNFDTTWKLEQSPAVSVRWLKAVRQAQKWVQNKADIKVPILLLRSNRSVKGKQWNDKYQKGDAVLDVGDISRYGKKLGNKVTEVVITDGMHDLILSSLPARALTYQRIFQWLDTLR